MYYQDTPTNIDEVLNNKHYHHSLKGCDIEVKYRKVDGFSCKEVYCKTHKVLCSKTGWEYGWYSGTNNRIYKDFTINCVMCGKEIKSKYGQRRYCDECKKLREREQTKKHNEIARAERIAKKLKEQELSKERELIYKKEQELKRKEKKGIKSRKLNDLIGFINQYINTGYYEQRIRNYTYNELVKKADKIIKKKIERDNKNLSTGKHLTKKKN